MHPAVRRCGANSEHQHRQHPRDRQTVLQGEPEEAGPNHFRHRRGGIEREVRA